MIKEFAVNVPLNAVSFGICGIAICRELMKRQLEPCLFPIGGQIDLSSQKPDEAFNQWVQKCYSKSFARHSRNNNAFRLWHLNNSLESVSKEQVLLSFWELDSPTESEINIVKNQKKVFFSTSETVRIYKDFGCDNVEFLPLGFDDFNFYHKDKQYFSDGRINFVLTSKLEPVRKRHEKVIKAWIKKFGGNRKYSLTCAIWNPFLKPEDNQALMNRMTDGVRVPNVNFLGYIPSNEAYNDMLNSASIIIGAGTENWNLPCFHAVLMGRHAVMLNAMGHKDWGTKESVVFFNPNQKIPCYDGMFFSPNPYWNNGNVYDFAEEDFIAGCEEAIKRFEANPVNQEGIKLRDKFTWSNTVDKILSVL